MRDTALSYPPELEIRPLDRPPDAVVSVPGSKSITNRALVLAALHGKGCTVEGALRSEDTEVMIDSLRRLGFGVEADWSNDAVEVLPRTGDRIIPARDADLFVANSGTSMRFLTALVSLGQGRYRLDGIPRMRERPIADLLDALRQLGVRASSERGNGCPPVVVEADGMAGGLVEVKGDVSSQFLSALLMAAPSARSEVTLRVPGRSVSWPYVQMTVSMMEQFGAEVREDGPDGFRVPAPQPFGHADLRYPVEPDASAASYFFAAAAIAGGRVGIPWGYDRSDVRAARYPQAFGSLQGDLEFLNVLVRMGCSVGYDSIRPDTSDCFFAEGGPLRGIDVDMNAISDTVMTLAAVACFAEGPTTIRNVAHIRHKETDRLAALATELRRLGAKVDEQPDGLTITPAPLHGAAVDTYNDHRMAMSLALVGLRVPGVVIRNPGCVAKTYPEFFQDLGNLRG